MEAVGAALKLGYNVIFSDVDIAMLRDPIDDLFLPGTVICYNIKYGIDVNYYCVECTNVCRN